MDVSKQTHWIPLADLMTGLMMIFMLITAIYISKVDPTTTLVLDEYKIVHDDMKLALQNEFAKDFKQWNAILLGDMTIRFNNPNMQFASGSSEISPEFQVLLKDFFPRYLKILRSEKFRQSVKEIRIEGHTSKFWRGVSERDAYFLNMELSQQRTRSTLKYLMSLPEFQSDETWLKEQITANGLSSSRPLLKNPKSLSEDEINQRVEFRIVTNAADKFEEQAFKEKNSK
jgi:outer membrane protein OmpA-like peptidoglycan-associated protein